MKTYSVTISRPRYEYAIVHIKADSEQAAIAEALAEDMESLEWEPDEWVEPSQIDADVTDYQDESP